MKTAGLLKIPMDINKQRADLLTNILSFIYARIVIFLVFSFVLISTAWPQVPLIYMPLPSLTNKDLAVIVNDADPLSLKIGRYYQKRRKIPGRQIIHINFNPGRKTMSREQFEVIKKQVNQKTPAHVQAFVLTWKLPYRVGCMSITTAFAAGYNESFCAKGCKPTLSSPYFNAMTGEPFSKLNWRPTMMLAGDGFAEVKALIDRGVASDFTNPEGSAYLLVTSDKNRSSRGKIFFKTALMFKGLWPVYYLEQDYIENKTDVMFYFTGLTHVPKIAANTFLPGAVADHLTSTGGVMSGGKQMSILAWLKAGATGSYGTVVEPCNFVQKFSNPAVLMHFYLRGNTLIEAYWKSVVWPGQGVFIGEPLARPFAFQ